MNIGRVHTDSHRFGRVFRLYLITITAFIFLPGLIYVATAGSLSQGLSWSIPLFVFYTGAINLFFIAKAVLVNRESIPNRFKGGFLIFLSLSLILAISDYASKATILHTIALHIHLQALLYCWNPIVLAMLMLDLPFPFSMLSVLLLLSIFAFYEFAVNAFAQKGIKRYMFVLLILLFSASASYYYLVPAKTFKAASSESGGYVLEVSANPVLDALPLASILRQNGVERFDWDDRWEHGPLIVKARHEDILNIKYRWIDSVSASSGMEVEPDFTGQVPVYMRGLVKKNLFWILPMSLILFYKVLIQKRSSEEQVK